MTGEFSDSSAKKDAFPNWIRNYELQNLVQLVEPQPRPDASIKQTEIPTSNATSGSLLAGKILVIRTNDRPTSSSTPPGLPPKRVQVARIPVNRASTGKPRRGWLGVGLSLIVLLVLAAFMWTVMKTSDFTDVDVFQGSYSGSLRLNVELGERVPDFTGMLLVEDPDRWGDTFSSADLLGQSTVLFIWGSWNEELTRWAQELNYARLVGLESANVQFVGLNLDRSRETALAAFNEDLISWPHIFNYDNRQENSERPMEILGIQSSPLILLIDATGRLRAQGLAPDNLVEVHAKLLE